MRPRRPTAIAWRCVILVVVTVVVLAGCGGTQPRALDREQLFSLSIGRAEDEIDLFSRRGHSLVQQNHLAMQDGFFYLSNAAGNKVMELTSYGDLISLWYNRDDNPQPVLLQSNLSDGAVANRRAHQYPFTRVGDIAVTDDKELYAVDLVTEERTILDQNLGVLLNRIVLRFDSAGNLVDYVGQEGVGGTPFPYIERIAVSRGGELVVVAKTADVWLVFWYDETGRHLYTAEIALDRLPVPGASDGAGADGGASGDAETADSGEDEEEEQESGAAVIPILESVHPDAEERRVYLKLNYYEESVDTETRARYGITTRSSRIYWLNLESGRYEGYFDIPKNTETATEGTIFDRTEVEFLYDFVGTAVGGHLFLLSRETDEDTELLIMNTEGRVVRRRMLTIEDDLTSYKDFHVSASGILTAMLGFDDRVDVVWWRSDRLIGG
ncbi:MAG: LIC_12708 family protein [Spirochaetota bacterium]